MNAEIWIRKQDSYNDTKYTIKKTNKCRCSNLHCRGQSRYMYRCVCQKLICLMCYDKHVHTCIRL